MSTKTAYIEMQRRAYEWGAERSDFKDGKIEDVGVVGGPGGFQAHNEHRRAGELLMYGVPDDRSWIGLDFGCGPGRNIVRFSGKLARIDGADIASYNLRNAADYCQANGLAVPNLYQTRGDDCGDAASEAYDLVLSAICLQHICVHSVRYSILTDFFRVLKSGGRANFQMGFGVGKPNARLYFDDYTDAQGTNSESDTMVERPEYLVGDLEKIGFKDVQHWIEEPLGLDDHPQWIFISAVKP